MRTDTLRRFVYAMFLCSGVSGLMYEVVWVRMLERMMGVTIYATSTVLAAFMAGLALGSFVAGRIVDRRKDALRLYALLEIAIGAAALLVPLLLMGAMPIYRALYDVSGGEGYLTSAVRAAICFVTLLLPTTMMGATLPILTSFLVKREAVFGRNFSLLYGLNTLGAVGGVVFSGFVTLGAVGEWGTIFIGVAINVGVGLLALMLYRSEHPVGAPEAPEAAPAADAKISPYPDAVRRFVLFASALSGLTALAYEVIWTRQLILFLRTSIYAFSGMLAIFLLGIALGSIVMNRKVDSLKAPLAVFAFLELIVAFLSVGNLYLYAPLDSHILHRLLGLSSAAYAAVLIVFPLAVVFGMITPVAARCFASSVNRTGASIGWLYGANTLGSIFGSLAAGFIFVPILGSTRTVMVLAVVNLALGVVLLAMEHTRTVARRLAYAPLILLVAAMAWQVRGEDPFLTAIESRIERRIGTTWIPDENRALPDTEQIYFHEEGIEGTVTAFEINRFKQLWINGTGMTFLNTETKMIAHLPLLFTEGRDHFLAVCFGMGTTIRSAARYPGLEVTTVELVPETFETFKYYHEDGEHVLAADNVNPVVDDGRNHLLMTENRYDVITVDPAPPIYSARTVNLYSQEFFEVARDRLTDDGVFLLWFPGGTEIEVRSLVRTFTSIFPHSTVWSGPHSWGYFLIGKTQPFDWNAFDTKVAELFADAERVTDLTEYDDSCATEAQLRTLLLWDETEVKQIAEGGVLISDNRPFTEFPLWRYALHGRAQWNPQWDLNIGNWKAQLEEAADGL